MKAESEGSTGREGSVEAMKRTALGLLESVLAFVFSYLLALNAAPNPHSEFRPGRPSSIRFRKTVRNCRPCRA